MFYETKNFLTADELKFESGVNFSFPLHLHNSFELIVVTEGEMRVEADKNTYELTAGKAVLIFPNQMHGIVTQQGKSSRHFLWIFSPKLVQAYGRIFLSKVPSCNLFEINSSRLSELIELSYGSGSPNAMSLKGVLYSLCGDFDRGREYTERKTGKEDLLLEIFGFVEKNYNGDCSLSALAARTSYHYVYLSKYFKDCTGIPFSDYVNRYRVNEACYLLENTEQSILRTAYDSGFDSLRSFNRNFKDIIGITPSKYKADLKKELL